MRQLLLSGGFAAEFRPDAALHRSHVLLLCRPQRKLQKEREKLQSELAVGAEVILANGIFGKVYHLKDDRVTIELESGRMVVHKSAIVGKADEAAKAIQA